MTKLLTDPDYARIIVNEAKSIRSPFEADWREAARFVLPRQAQAWDYSGAPASHGMEGFSSQANRRQIYDSTGRRMLPRFIAVIDRMLTPRGQRWSKLQTNDESLNRKWRVKEFYDRVNEVLFHERYNPAARFTSATGELYASIGAFGNAGQRIEARKRGPISRPGLLYRTLPLRDVFWRTNSDGDRDTVLIRHVKNARQMEMDYGRDALPQVVKTELERKNGPSETRYYELFEIVTVNYDDYDPEALDNRRFAWNARTLLPEARAWVDERQGYISCPYVTSRYFTEPGDIYATSPAITAAPAMGTASAMKRHMLKLGERSADPPLLAHDDGILVDTRPNAVTAGGLDRNGNPLVRPLISGADFRLNEQLLQDERSDIEDTFFGRLFNILEETREMTAREVAERVSKEFTLVAPTMGRMQEEHLGPLIQREIDVLLSDPELARKMPEVPPELDEAAGEFEVVYTSPLARAERMEDVQGFMQTVQIALQAAEATQDRSYVEIFDFDTALPEIAEISNVPVRWMRDPEELAAKREQQEQRAQAQQAIEAAPALAGAMKAMQGGAQ